MRSAAPAPRRPFDAEQETITSSYVGSGKFLGAGDLGPCRSLHSPDGCEVKWRRGSTCSKARTGPVLGQRGIRAEATVGAVRREWRMQGASSSWNSGQKRFTWRVG